MAAEQKRASSSRGVKLEASCRDAQSHAWQPSRRGRAAPGA